MLREMWNGMQHLSKGVEVYRCAASVRAVCEHPRTRYPSAAGSAATRTTPQKGCPTAAHPSSREPRWPASCRLGGRAAQSLLSRASSTPCRPTCPYNSQWKSGGYFGDHMNWLYSESMIGWCSGVLASPRRPAAPPAVWCDPDVLEHSNGRLVKCTSEPQAPDAYCFTSAETNWCGAASQEGWPASQLPVTLPLPLRPGRTTPCFSCGRGSTIGSGRSRWLTLTTTTYLSSTS